MKLSLLPFYLIQVFVTLFIVVIALYISLEVILHAFPIPPSVYIFFLTLAALLTGLCFYIFFESLIRILRKWKSVQ